MPAAVVRKAYRDAVLRFHPDRQREASLAQRVRAEEAFKLITSLYRRKCLRWKPIPRPRGYTTQ